MKNSLLNIAYLTRAALILCTFLCISTNAWAGSACNYADLSVTKYGVKNGNTYWAFGTRDYYDIPTFEFGSVSNEYGISHITLVLEFPDLSGISAVTEKFQPQYKIGSGAWTNLGDNFTVGNDEVTKNYDVAIAGGSIVYFQLVRVEKAKFTDSQKFTLSATIRMAKSLSGSESELSFDDQIYNTTSSALTREFTFSNIETGKSISISSNTNSSEFPATLSKSGDCDGTVTVNVQFKPSQKGTRSGSITVLGDCGSKTFSVSGTGLVATPTLILSATTGIVDRTSNVLSPNYFDLSSLISTYVGDGYAYSISSDNSEHGYIIGDNFYATEAGDYTIRISSPEGDHYGDTFSDDATYRTVTITVRDKAHPSFEMNCTQAVADALLVDGTITNAFNISNVSNDADFNCYITPVINSINNGNGKVIEYNAVTNTIIAHNAGTATLQFVQTENEGYYGAASEVYTFTVSKHITTLDGLVLPMSVDATSQIGSYLTENTSAAIPAEGTSNDFYYTITNTTLHTPTVVTGCAEGHETDVIGYTPSTHTITAYNAGTAKLTIAQKETYKYTGDTLELNVTVDKYTPSFTWNPGGVTYYYKTKSYDIFTTTSPCDYTFESSNPASAIAVKGTKDTLIIYNVEEPATITVTQEENYLWNGKEVEYVITPVNQNNHVPFTVTGANKGTFVTVAEDDAEWNGDNGYKMGAGKIIMDNAPYSYIIIQFVGIPDKLTFRATCDKVGIGAASSYPIGNNYYFDVYESEDGSFGDTPIWSNPNRGTKYSEIGEQNYTVQLAPTTRYVKLRYHGTCYGHFRNIHISELHKFTSNPKETLDFGTEGLNYGEQTELIAFNHANAGRITSAEITGEDANYFRVAPSTIAGTGRDLYGTAYLAVTFDNVYNEERKNKGDNAYNATLTIRDNDSTRVITLTGKRFGKSYPKFTFNPNHLPYYYGATIANIASSSNTDYANCPLSFETTDSQIAYVDEDGRLHIGTKEGPVTITVRQNNGNADYYSGSATFTFTPRVRPDLAVPFFINKAKYDEGILTPGQDADMTWNSDPNNEIRLGDGWVLPTSWGVKSFVVEFAGTPDKVSFQYKTNKTTTSSQFGDGDILKAPIWTVEESSNGSDWTRVWRDVNNSNSYASSVTECLLKENTRYLRFSYNGNGYGYFKNIKVTELVGYKYLRASDGEYLSRGGKWATQAVTDAFGIPCRLMNETGDNEHSYTRFEYADSKECLYETDAEIFTDNKTANSQNALWHVDYVDGTLLRLRSANTAFGKQGYYVTDSEGAMALTSDAAAATLWVMEDYTEHGPYMASIFDAEAAAAAREEFGSDVNTRAKVHDKLTTEDFEKEVISIETVSPAQRSTEGEFRNGVSGARDVYDFVKTGLTPGFYILSVKAMFRVANSETAWENHQRGTESVVAYAYANNVKYPIQSVYASYQNPQIEGSDERHDVLGEPHYYSTTLSSATTAFGDLNRYNNDIYVLVGEDGRLEYGMKCPSYVPGAWLAYAGVTLTRVARKQYIFNGSVDDEWTTDGSWNRGSQPNIHHEVIIDHDVIIESEIAAYSVTINEGKTVTIAPNGGLTVGAGGVRGASAEKLILKAGTAEDGALKGQTGYLRISPYSTQPMPEATVELFSIGYYDYNDKSDNIAKWQYVGSPLASSETLAKTVYTKSWVYGWNESTDEWTNQRPSFILRPFVGFATTQRTSENGMLVKYAGQLVSSTTNENIALVYSGEGRGHNVLANSFSAPIDITKFEDSDFKNADSAIYIFNTGSRTQAEALIAKKSADVNAPGQYLAIPIGSARLLKGAFGMPTVIAPMQGFCVHAHKDDAAITLDYNKLVWNGNYVENPNTPLRISAHKNLDEEQVGNIQISLYTDGGVDYLFMLESDQFDARYESGFDARKLMGDELNIFSVIDDEQLAVDATNSIIGTRVGVRTGEETAYTFVFSKMRSENELALFDAESNQIIDINEGTEYTFFAEPNSMIVDRFQIVERDNAPAITTDIDNVENETKAHKFIKNNQLYILKNGVLYSATGAVVR